MTRRNSFAPHLPKPALLPLLVLLALPPCTSQAGFLQEFYDDANLQSSYTAPGLYASASMDTVTGGRFILKANREDFQPYYLQGPELKAGCGGIDVFLGAFSIPSKDEFVSFVRSIGTALPVLAFHAALQSLAPDLNEQISQFRDMLMRYASMLGDSCQIAENIMPTNGSRHSATRRGIPCAVSVRPKTLTTPTPSPVLTAARLFPTRPRALTPAATSSRLPNSISHGPSSSRARALSASLRKSARS